uniref:Uncharacterized protein n=1 Tax=Rhizophora mucronata TaxID=61149 RepID=A0A2P2Q3Y4_RHIMU
MDKKLIRYLFLTFYWRLERKTSPKAFSS